tara:strand:+ start:20 stop:1633 length:1614 start_codon:yes stop_codon:yes gene_type:complete
MLIYNGEIYNYTELQKRLQDINVVCSGESDTEVLFLCLVHFGIKKTLKIIDGMFAFAFYDDLKKKLYLARDRIGEKFIYWSKINNSLIFASEIKTLVQCNKINIKPNLKKINEIFYHRKIYGKETLFENIFELEAGTYLEYTIKESKIRIFSYWKLENFKMVSAKSDYLEEFEYNFLNSVKSRMVSDVPIGSLISGGIDSSALVQTMLDIESNLNLNLFFYEAKIKKFNEKNDVNLFLGNMKSKYPLSKINLHTVRRKSHKFLNEYSKMTYHYDEPLTFNNFHLVSDLTKKAYQKNIKVIFSGEGVDELLFGYDRFFRTSRIISQCKNDHEKLQNIYFGAGINNIEIIAQLNNKSNTMEYQDSCSWKYLKKIYKDFDSDTVQILFSQKFRLIGLLQRQDRAAMANSVESRAPFLAPKFFNWVNGLPIDVKRNIKKNKNKIILKNYMSKKVPERILNKNKIGFITDFDLWLNSYDFINYLKKIVLNKDSFSSTYLDISLIIKILNLPKTKIENYFFLLSSIYTLECWFDVFFNKKKSM